MEIRTLRYFLAVAREENMTRAAEVLHVTQPTLSKALKTLEEELGKNGYIPEGRVLETMLPLIREGRVIRRNGKFAANK